MKKADFKKLHFFSYDELDYKGNFIFHNQEILRMTKFELMIKLDMIRREIEYPIILHCTYEPTGHTKHSFHYVGMAADFHFITDEKFTTQIEDILNIIRINRWFVGLGIYPDWKHRGLHLDVRGRTARWGRIGDEYVSIDKALEYCYKNKL